MVTVSHRKEDHRHGVHFISRQTEEGGAEPNNIVFLASDTQTSKVPIIIWVLKEDSRGGQWSCLHREAVESHVSQSETPVHDSAWMAAVCLFDRAATHKLKMALLSVIQPKWIPVNSVCSDTTLSLASAALSKLSLYLHGCNGCFPVAARPHQHPQGWKLPSALSPPLMVTKETTKDQGNQHLLTVCTQSEAFNSRYLPVVHSTKPASLFLSGAVPKSYFQDASTPLASLALTLVFDFYKPTNLLSDWTWIHSWP